MSHFKNHWNPTSCTAYDKKKYEYQRRVVGMSIKYYVVIVMQVRMSTYRRSVFRFCAHWWRRYLVSGGQLVDVHHVSWLGVHHEIPGAVKRFFTLDTHQRQAALVQVSGPFCSRTRKTNIGTGKKWNLAYAYNSKNSKILYNKKC